MQERLDSQERLKILQALDRHRRWYSLDDKRLCAICDRIIDGHKIEIRSVADQFTLHCPTPDCPSNYSHWFLYHESGVPRESVGAPAAVGEMSFISWADR